MIIIELIGIPGCGKTTTLNKAFEYRGEKKSILFLNEGFSFQAMLILKAIIGFVKHRKQVICFYKKWRNVVKCVDHVIWSIRYKIAFFELLQFIYFYDLIKKSERKYEVAISDQWVLQHTFSLFHDQPIPDNAIKQIVSLIEEIYNAFDGFYYVIMCSCESQRVIQQLRRRTDGRSVIDGLNKKDLENIVSIQQDNLSKVYSLIGENKKTNILFDGKLEYKAKEMNNIINEIYEKR